MPRIATIVSLDVPAVELFVATAYTRVPDAVMSPAEDLSTLAFFIDALPTRPALSLARPTMVMDRCEVARVLQVEPPASWDLAVLTQCLVPFEKECDPMLEVVQDVSIMTGGLLVRQGKVVPTPRQWPWRLGADGRWVPVPPLPTPGPGAATR